MRINSFSSHQTLLCPIAYFPLFKCYEESLPLMYYYFLKVHLLLSIPFLTLRGLFFVTAMFFHLTSIRLVHCRILCILKDSFKQTLSSFPPLRNDIWTQRSINCYIYYFVHFDTFYVVILRDGN